MNLCFILGQAGSGKTHYILHKVRETVLPKPAGLPVILLVPEQATFQMEYMLAAKMGLGGTIRAQVLSFRRLAYRVLLETGGAARVPIGDLGKRMVLRELLERHKKNLRVFGKSAGRPGFADCLARSISEMKTYLISPDRLANASQTDGQTAALLQDKLADLAFLYRELEEYLIPRYTDPDDYLNLLAEKIINSSSLQGAEFWLDGFKGFTPQEIAVIEKVFQVGKHVHVSLCLDPKCLGINLAEDHPFYPTWKTWLDLTRVAERTRVKMQKPVLLTDETPYRFRRCPEIAHLEKNYYRYPAPVFTGQQLNIKLVAGANRRAEVEACAREVIRLVRDKGYRWRDIALLLRDLEPYHELIGEVFQDYEIPFFIDRKRTIMHHPLVELIRSALAAVVKGWAYEPVFRYLKTDLVPVSREKVYLLENYVLAHGIRGAKWTEEPDWTYRRLYTLGEDQEISDKEQLELAAINQARKEAAGALAGFSQKVTGAKTVREITAVLYELLEELGVRGKIEEAQIWTNIIKLLDEVVEALGDEEIPLDIYSSILDAGFESMTIGLIPPGLDQVVAGSLDRSRNPDVKAAFLLGISEGVIPARLSNDGIFSDSDREKLAVLGITLAPGGRRRAFEEQFIIYTALTRAGERLWFSYPAADDEGKAIAPSPVIARIKELVPLLAEKRWQVEPLTDKTEENTEFIVHPGRALTYLTARLREAKTGRNINPVWWDLYNWFLEEDRREKARSILQSIFHVNIEKSIGQISRFLYGNPMKASVSRMEQFMACPFAHFSLYGLRLKERNIYRLEAPDMGEFYHAALKSFAEVLQKKSLDWGTLSREECVQINEKLIEELAPRLQSEILLSTARYRYLTGKLKRNINRAVTVLVEHARRSKFRPAGLELVFGPEGQLPPMMINLPNEESLQLAGRIDRVDIARTDECFFLRIIDYKSSDQNIDPEDIYYGLRLQLLTYLHAALTHFSSVYGQEGKPAGILYFTVKEPLIPGSGPIRKEDSEKAVLTKLKMRGLLLADREVIKMMDNLIEEGRSELFRNIALRKDGSFYSNASVISEDRFALLRSHLMKVFLSAGEEILKGNVNIKPYRKSLTTACRYCSFGSVCKFDHLLAGNAYRTLAPLTRDTVWHLMAAEGEKE